MSKAKAGINQKNALQAVAFTRNVVVKMTANPSFPAAVPDLPALTTAANNLETAVNAALAARTASKLATQQVKDKFAALRALVTQEMAYVQTASNGDAAKIESSGFEVAADPSPIGILPAPENLELDANVNPGNMGVIWKSVDGAASYIVERASDGPGPRVYVGVAAPTVARAIVNSMTSGQRYWFRVAAVNAAGVGFFTLEVSKIAP